MRTSLKFYCCANNMKTKAAQNPSFPGILCPEKNRLSTSFRIILSFSPEGDNQKNHNSFRI